MTRHKNKSVSVFRQNAILPLAAYVSYAAMLAAQAMLATPGFPCVTSLRPMLLSTAGFSVRGVFRSQPAAKTLPAWVIALL